MFEVLRVLLYLGILVIPSGNPKKLTRQSCILAILEEHPQPHVKMHQLIFLRGSWNGTVHQGHSPDAVNDKLYPGEPPVKRRAMEDTRLLRVKEGEQGVVRADDLKPGPAAVGPSHLGPLGYSLGITVDAPYRGVRVSR